LNEFRENPAYVDAAQLVAISEQEQGRMGWEGTDERVHQG
jgi:hypothetical protein